MATISSNKPLSVFSLVMINIIAIDSLRNLPVNAVNGLSIPFFYLIACLFFMIPCALVTAVLATHYPKTGGSYVWVRQAFGARLGFIAIWLQWIYNVFWYPTILAFVATNIAYFIHPELVQSKLYLVSTIIGLFTLASLVNWFGMQLSSFMSILSAIIGTIIPMTLIILLGGLNAELTDMSSIRQLGSWIPDLSQSNNLALFGIILFSVFGLEMSATHAESVQNPEKNYPKALLYSSVFIVLSLVLASLAIAFIVPHDQLNILSGLDQAMALVLAKSHASFLLPLFILAIIIGSLGGISAWVIGPAKGLMVAADEGNLPRELARLNRFGSPTRILLLQWLLVILLCGLFIYLPSFNTSYWLLSNITAQLALLFYLLFFAAAFSLSYRLPNKSAAFKLKPWFLKLVSSIGLLLCLAAFIIGFIPPTAIFIPKLSQYEAFLLGGIVIFVGLGFLFSTRKTVSE
jgi:amino acid transporter